MISQDLAKILFQLGTYGPLGVMAIVLFVLLMRQQKECKELRDEHAAALVKERAKTDEQSEKLFTLLESAIKADTEHTESVRALTKVLDSVDRRLS